MIGGAPRRWAAVWVALCLYLGLMDVTLHKGHGLPYVLFLWMAGQGTLIRLSKWDGWWDNVLLAQILHRYKRRYEAG